MAESRQELVNWVNDLLLIDISKVEQCGTGAAYCQIFDSIFLDVPMSKVRYDVNTEYQYLNNFKVLQNTFLKHKIDRVVPVERLVKCRFQDNLEFLQWVRKFWDANYPGHEYDPLSRRKAGPIPTSAANRPATGSRNSSAAGSRAAITTSTANSIRSATTAPSTRNASGSSLNSTRRPPSVQRSTPGVTGPSSASASASAIRPLKEKITELESEHEQLVNTVDILETERNFYYDKLFNIELLIQQAVDDLDKNKTAANGDTTNDTNNTTNGTTATDHQEPPLPLSAVEETYATLVREIQTILYKTTDGFEIPTQEYETEETF